MRTADPRVDFARLSPDGRSLHLEFVGGPDDPSNPCSVQYEAITELSDGELVVAVVAQQRARPVPSGTACDAVGYLRAIDLRLPQGFHGSVIRDKVTGEVVLPRPSDSP
jgi:hypothetical protein